MMYADGVPDEQEAVMEATGTVVSLLVPRRGDFTATVNCGLADVGAVVRSTGGRVVRVEGEGLDGGALLRSLGVVVPTDDPYPSEGVVHVHARDFCGASA